MTAAATYTKNLTVPLYDPHGSVSVLLDQTGGVKASYGYSAYGSVTKALAAGFSASVNPYRYTSKRYDSGSATLDMGARRYSPTQERFLQPDQYDNALDNLALARNAATNNRYQFTGANPVNYIEIDGHKPMQEGDLPTVDFEDKAKANCLAKDKARWVQDYWCQQYGVLDPRATKGSTSDIIVGGAIAVVGLLPVMVEFARMTRSPWNLVAVVPRQEFWQGG